MNLKFNIDAAKIAQQMKEFALEVEQDLQKAVANLAAITHAKVAEQAQQELHSTRKVFMDNLGFEELSPGVWVISIDQDALFIEEGIPTDKDMRPDLLKNDAKTSKSGTRYKVVPFEHSKAPSQLTGYSKSIVTQIKQNLKKENVPFKKIEYNADGSPRTGKLHEFNFGGPKPGKGNTPAMKGVSIYQTVTKTGNVRRDVLTFRTVSSGPGSEGKWVHPGLEPKHYLEKSLEWAMREWEEKILPEVLEKWK